MTQLKLDATLMMAGTTGAAAAAKTFEDQGFDGVLSFEGPHEPFLPLALAATATTRVELTTGIAIAFARNPMICAQTANDLQLISEGRFILGLGTQIRPHIEKRFSQTWSHPNRRMHEFVRAVRAIWDCWNGGEPLNFRGEFYQHTLMTPIFMPGANPHGLPPIFLAGFGPGMITVAGEVGDGWIVHPLHTRSYLQDVAIPALRKGQATAGRNESDCKISAQVVTMIGENDEQIAKARDNARAQLAFYSSTPAYRVVLDHSGWGDIQPELNRLSKAGKWLDMLSFISDDMLDNIGVSGTPSAVAAELAQRYDFADRLTLILYNEASPDVVTDIVRDVHEASAKN